MLHIKCTDCGCYLEDCKKSDSSILCPNCTLQECYCWHTLHGFGIDSTHTFTDLRGGQEDTGDEQALVVWTAAGKSLDQITSDLQAISEPLPYE